MSNHVDHRRGRRPGLGAGVGGGRFGDGQQSAPGSLLLLRERNQLAISTEKAAYLAALERTVGAFLIHEVSARSLSAIAVKSAIAASAVRSSPHACEREQKQREKQACKGEAEAAGAGAGGAGGSP